MSATATFPSRDVCLDSLAAPTVELREDVPFNWFMDRRYSGRDNNRDGLADYFTPHSLTPNFQFLPGKLARGKLINPPRYIVNVRAGAGCTDATVGWAIDYDFQESKKKCRTEFALTPGQHRIAVAYGDKYHAKLVNVKDYLIAAIGDSYGSGEGNPDVPRVNRRGSKHDRPSRWQSKPCHRTANAGAAKAAAQVETSDDFSSVTFLHFSCSGATINKGLTWL